MSTAETMRFICIGCGYRARIPATYAGKVILCPSCKQMQIATADGGDSTGDTVRVTRVATAQGGNERFSVPDAEGRLKFTCGVCGYSAKLASTYAGKAIACPQCKSPQLIPPLEGDGGEAGKAVPSPGLETATAMEPEAKKEPAMDDELTFDEEPAKPTASAKPKPKPKPPAPAADDGVSFDDEPVGPSDSDNGSATPATVAKSTTAPPAAKPANKPGVGGVVRRGSRAAKPVASEPDQGDDDDVNDEPAKPAKSLPPWVKQTKEWIKKEPRKAGIIGGSLAGFILLIVLITGWVGASSEAEEFRLTAEANQARADTLSKEKGVIEDNLSKTTEDFHRLKKSEGEVKAALEAAEKRLAELGEQLNKAEADKASEYTLRKKAEADHDELFSKLKTVERKRDEEYRNAIELRRKYEEEAKLRKDLKVRLDEAQAAAK